jgi:hypothetical protein
MKISKRQLRRIIKEETVRQQSREGLVGAEGALLGELMTIISDLMTIEKELYGLVEPGQHRPDPGAPQMGDVYGDELNAVIEEVENFREKLDAHFELYDDLAGRNPGGSVG